MWATLGANLLTNMGMNLLNKMFSGGSKKNQVQQQPAYTPTPMPEFASIPTLSQADALRQAQGMVNPLYDQQLEQALKNIDYQNMQRGFYGQLPGDVLRGARALDVERARAGQTTNLAQQLLQQSQANALAQQQLQLQQWLAQNQLGMQQQQLGMQQKQADRASWMDPLNLGLRALESYADQTGSPLWVDISRAWNKPANAGEPTYNMTWNQMLDMTKGVKDDLGRQTPIPY